jgi:ParB family chromosome partitioning protein
VADALARAEAAEHDAASARARAEEATALVAEADARASEAQRDRDAAQAALSEANGALARASEALTAASDAAATDALRAELDASISARDELEIALSAEREARAALERKLAELAMAGHAGTAAAPQVMAAPAFNPDRPSLPPLEVAAAQAKAFAYAAPADDDGPPPGLTPDALAELDAALAKSSSPRAAGRAALQVLATATGWQGGALWQPRDEGEFGCAETWSAYMSGLEAWETMAWRAHLEDGLVPAAAGSGEPHWADTEEMLACPRSRSAAWAELGTLATVPVCHPDGRVLAVLELVRKERDPADRELLATLAGVAERLAERLAVIENELDDERTGARM